MTKSANAPRRGSPTQASALKEELKELRAEKAQMKAAIMSHQVGLHTAIKPLTIPSATAKIRPSPKIFTDGRKAPKTTKAVREALNG
eukprot:1195300-Prorocentrum_minimum.AAC.1